MGWTGLSVPAQGEDRSAADDPIRVLQLGPWRRVSQKQETRGVRRTETSVMSSNSRRRGVYEGFWTRHIGEEPGAVQEAYGRGAATTGGFAYRLGKDWRRVL